jgi:hypothetical protein
MSPARLAEKSFQRQQAKTQQRARGLAGKAFDRAQTIPLPAKYAITRGDTTLEDNQIANGAWSVGSTGEIRLPTLEPGSHIGRPEMFEATHEMAHALDEQSLDDPWRRRFASIMGAPAGPWQTGTGTDGGKRSPNEWFGDYYAASAVNLRPQEGMGSYVDNIDPKRLRAFRRALSEFAATKPELEPLRRRAIRRALSAPSAG